MRVTSFFKPSRGGFPRMTTVGSLEDLGWGKQPNLLLQQATYETD
jgi:hypothetical protein